MQTLARITGLAAFTALVMLSYGSPSAWAKKAEKAETYATIAFSPGATVSAGTKVTIKGKAFCDSGLGVCTEKGQVLNLGKIQIHPALDAAGAAVDCASSTHFGDQIGMGVPENNFFSIEFDTAGLGGQTLGFRVHYVTPGGQDGPKNSVSACADLTIMTADPLPDGTLSYGQGFYGSSPRGEALVAQLVDGSTCDAIYGILADSGLDAPSCATGIDRNPVALFLTGIVGSEGGNNDDGFLPAGNPSENGPGLNLAAQKITLLLNLNLDALLEVPIESRYFINIDPVQDIVAGAPGPFVDPVFNNHELYENCVDTVDDSEDICDKGTLVLSALGLLVQTLDEAGTTVEDICTAALAMIEGGWPLVLVNNSVEVTRGDMTDILGLINESYDEATPTGFITLGDVD